MSITTLGPIFNTQQSKTRQWSISLSLFDEHGGEISARGCSAEDVDVRDGYYAAYTTSSGYTGMKMTVSATTVVRSGKNLGRKNATNVLTQALKDCRSKYDSKLKAGYTTKARGQSSRPLPFPMAVKTWRDHGHKLKYPLFVQPKLDGVRMLARLGQKGGELQLATRRLHDIAGFESVKAALRAMFEASDSMRSFVIDGELYSHGADLQTISGIVRNVSLPETSKDKLAFHVFDCFDTSQPLLPFAERHALLKKFVSSARSRFVRLTETKQVASAGDADAFFKEAVCKGYEGVVYKSTDRKYEFDFNKERRSAWYLKRKKQDDAEYTIVGFGQGKGKDAGCVVFALETAGGKRFNCVPNGTYAYRKEIYEQAAEDFALFEGRLAKVQFDDLSKDGVPLRGRIVQIGRDYSFD